MEGSAAVPEQQQPAPAQEHMTLGPLRRHKHYQGGRPGARYVGSSSFMQRMSEKVASGMGAGALVIIAQKAQTRTGSCGDLRAEDTALT